MAYHRSAETGWTTYVVNPRNVVLGPVNSVKYLSILLITALILFSFIFIYFSTRNLLLPIRKAAQPDSADELQQPEYEGGAAYPQQ